MDAHVRQLAAGQDDVVAAWQLLAAGFSRGMLQHRLHCRGWRVVHPGVYALTSAPLTRRQRWIAATLTSPDSVLSHASSGACQGIRPFDGILETITRPGSGGPRRLGNVLICRSTTLAGDVTCHDGIRVTTAARTLIDLAPHLLPRATERAFREALRLKATTTRQLNATLSRHRGRRGTRLLGDLARRYEGLPYHRTRSDAESRALELLEDAGVDVPRANTVIGGEEADLAWPHRRLIVEIDGPQYHQFPAEDARKQRKWEAAGYRVRRIPSDAVYNQPERLIALVRGG